MTKRVRPALVAALALLAGLGAASVQAQGFNLRGSERDRDEDYRRADASAVVAAELAFARAAQEKGQWTAFAEFAADDAVMFVPEPVNAQAWLKGRANPPQAVRWQPHQVWSSCDGSLAVTKGAWQRPDGSVGYFTTVWQRQGNKKKSEYRWVMDQGDTLTEPLEAPEMIDAKAADCGGEPFPPIVVSGPSDMIRTGASEDGTLHWDVTVGPDGSRRVNASYWDGTGWQRALREQVSAGG